MRKTGRYDQVMDKDMKPVVLSHTESGNMLPGDKTRVTIRNMQPEDLMQIMVMERELYTDPWTEEGYLSSLQQTNTCFVSFAAEDGSIIGYLGGYLSFEEVEIVKVSIRRDLQGRGLGRRMLTEYMYRLESQGSAMFLLEVRKSNLAARALYTRCGFEEIGIRKNLYEQPVEDAVIMQRFAKNVD